jgi:hypothetical protein
MPGCIFCGSTTAKRTKEHIIADWIARLFDGYGRATAGIISRDGSMRQYTMPLFQQTTRKVCSVCNSGWMSSLEGAVRPILGPMLIQAQETPLDVLIQKSLATWTVKTALMLQSMHTRDRLVPDSEYRRLYDDQQPPRGYGVWLAHRSALTDSTGRELLAASIEEPIYRVRVPTSRVADFENTLNEGHIAFTITFSIGHVAFQVFGHNLPGNFQIAFGFEDAMNWIWPPRGHLTWPPRHNIESVGGLLAFHRAFQGPPPGP